MLDCHNLQRAPLRSFRSLMTAALLGGVLLTLSGCVTKPAGSTGFDAFIAESTPQKLSGSESAEAAAKCFEERASFLPLSEFSRDPQAASFTYRLRLAGQWYEQVRISADGSGSHAEIRIAPHLDAHWHANFERDRVATLKRCLGA